MKFTDFIIGSGILVMVLVIGFALGSAGTIWVLMERV